MSLDEYVQYPLREEAVLHVVVVFDTQIVQDLLKKDTEKSASPGKIRAFCYYQNALSSASENTGVGLMQPISSLNLVLQKP